MNNLDLKSAIQANLKGFATVPLRQAATGLLNALGYSSDKTIELDGPRETFLEQFNRQPETTRFNEKKALVEECQEIHSNSNYGQDSRLVAPAVLWKPPANTAGAANPLPFDAERHHN